MVVFKLMEQALRGEMSGMMQVDKFFVSD